MTVLSHRSIIALVLGMLLVNFVLRYSSLAALSRVQLPRPLMRWLSYVPIAVMGALLATEVLIPAVEGSAHVPVYLNPGLYGLTVAMLAFRFTKSFMGGTIVGIVVFALVRLLVRA
jgi:branched-subunit amino acid transport protein